MGAAPFPDFEARLRAYAPPPPGGPTTQAQAAVAALLRARPGELELLLMRRAERAEDKWSGQISMPGGRAEPSDADLFATAVRETREEVGLDLERVARPLCRLTRIRANARGRVLPLQITPFVFLETEPAPVELGEEATETFWFPLGRAAAGELDAIYPYRHGEEALELPCWRFEKRVVWGLTYRMVSGLMRILAS